MIFAALVLRQNQWMHSVTLVKGTYGVNRCYAFGRTALYSESFTIGKSCRSNSTSLIARLCFTRRSTSGLGAPIDPFQVVHPVASGMLNP